jgi:hypothetical protein
MPLQPPNPEFLSQAPGPRTRSADAGVTASAGSARSGSAGSGALAGSDAARAGWPRPAEIAGMTVVLLAAAFGFGELIT